MYGERVHMLACVYVCMWMCVCLYMCGCVGVCICAGCVGVYMSEHTVWSVCSVWCVSLHMHTYKSEQHALQRSHAVCQWYLQ